MMCNIINLSKIKRGMYMKIALLSETYFPYINGITTHIKTLRDGFLALGHEVLIITCSPTTKKHYLKDGVLYCPAKALKSIYRIWRIISI